MPLLRPISRLNSFPNQSKKPYNAFDYFAAFGTSLRIGTITQINACDGPLFVFSIIFHKLHGVTVNFGPYAHVWFENFKKICIFSAVQRAI